MNATASRLDEFGLIAEYFRDATLQRPDVTLGIGDDAAVVRVPADRELVIAVDTLVSGVHFPVSTPPAAIGYKALAVNLSDLAAMGATPCWASLALTLPVADRHWLAEFSRGFFELANRYGVQLIGGDTTRGPLSLSVQIHGLVPIGSGLRRAGARVGDGIYVTGPLGLAAFALQRLQGDAGHTVPEAIWAGCLERLYRPSPRVDFGVRLRDLASSAIDISDGLAADLGHVLQASGAGAELQLAAVPTVQDLLPGMASEQAWELALAGGDDYELCCTVPVEREPALAEAAKACGIACTRIGTITAEPGLRLYRSGGERYEPGTTGYRHF